MALWQHGYLGLLAGQFWIWGGAQVLVDLVIALMLVLVWMWRDCQATGRNVWPWVVLTLVAGSFGTLGYLITRQSSDENQHDGARGSGSGKFRLKKTVDALLASVFAMLSE